MKGMVRSVCRIEEVCQVAATTYKQLNSKKALK